MTALDELLDDALRCAASDVHLRRGMAAVFRCHGEFVSASVPIPAAQAALDEMRRLSPENTLFELAQPTAARGPGSARFSVCLRADGAVARVMPTEMPRLAVH